jgi:hypothetical protein
VTLILLLQRKPLLRRLLQMQPLRKPLLRRLLLIKPLQTLLPPNSYWLMPQPLHKPLLVQQLMLHQQLSTTRLPQSQPPLQLKQSHWEQQQQLLPAAQSLQQQRVPLKRLL